MGGRNRFCGGVVRQRGSVLLDERPQSAGAGHDPASVLPRGGTVHPDVARGGHGVRFDSDLEHVCTKHDMTQQHAASSLPAASLRSAIVAERLQRVLAVVAVCPLSTGLLVSVAAHSAPIFSRRLAGAEGGRGGGLTH